MSIPVRNIRWLLLYASDLSTAANQVQLAAEELPEEIPDLVAEILARSVEQRQRRQLSKAFQPREAVLSRIDHLSTARRQLLAQGRIACRFEELTVDSPRNRFVRSAVHSVAQLVRKPELAHRCRGLALPTEEAGPNAVLDPQRCVRWLRTLYERAIGGFYRLHLDQAHWRVRTGKPLTWWMEDASSGIAAVFPSMRTDIVIDHCDGPQRLVIDTKFTGVYRRGWHREQTLRSGYV